ncbi:hypothetical protein K440DRAFT_661287 [Wilcoxina mikolae CBS 423.85]|nr:hypothetical protein K440DRAFT_661287 [Wilcoxina mikolae CBS 423.85]
MGPTRLVVTIMGVLGILLSFSITVRATAIANFGAVPIPEINLLVARQDTCSDSGSRFCNITGAASSFCCPSTTECIPLENATTVICCKINETCTEIHPVICPDSPKASQRCGKNCCPLGFECDGSGSKCTMKPENLPEKYKQRQDGGSGTGKNESSAVSESQASSNPILPTGSISCPAFPAKAIVVGLFPGIVIGAALMMLWSKMVEIKTRRRSIKSFGVFNNYFPSEANLTEKRVTKKSSFPGGFSRQQQPQIEESSFSPLSFSFRSPNLGPPIPPVRSRSQGGSPGRTPPIRSQPSPAQPSPAAARSPPAPQASASKSPNIQTQNVDPRESDPKTEFKPPPAPRTKNFTRLPPAVDPRPESGMTLFSDISPVQKRSSFETGYSASVYNDGNELGAFPFMRAETAIPPIPKPAPLFYRQAGGPMPRPPVEGWRNVGVGGRL